VTPRCLPHRASKARSSGRRGGSAGHRSPSAPRDLVEEFNLVLLLGIVIGQIRVVAPGEPNTQQAMAMSER